MLLEYYKTKLGIKEMPDFLKKYLELPIIERLKYITYLCGMDYASKDVYDFKEKITRYDHSLTTALMTWNLTQDKETTIAALFHDAATPCFSHVIDFMNGDRVKQESTEEPHGKILRSSVGLKDMLESDGIDIGNIINFKQYSVVDLERPKLCADRLDGIILTGISWAAKVDENMIDAVVRDITVYENEDKEKEIGFVDEITALDVCIVNQRIDYLCNQRFDYYMMNLLADIVKLGMDKGYYSYESLYKMTEIVLLDILNNTNDGEILSLLDRFYNIKESEIPLFKVNNKEVKSRVLKPFVSGERL